MIIRIATLLLSIVPTIAFAESLTWGSSGSTTDNFTDPYSWSRNHEWRIGQQIFEPLVLKGTGDDFIPVLAQNLEFSKLGELRIILREEILFHSGAPFKAEDVVFSLERAAAEDSEVMHLASVFHSVVAKSDTDVRAMFSGTRDQAIFALSKIMMVSKQWHSDNGSVYGQANGTGAFMLSSHEAGVRIELVRFEEYREQLQHPYDRVEILAINNQDVALSAILTGELDVVDNVPFEDTQRASRQVGLQVRQFPTDTYFVVEANAERQSTPAHSDSIYLPHLQKTLSQVLAGANTSSSGYSLLSDVSAFDDWQDIENLTPSDGFPDSVTIYCQYESGFLGDICKSFGSKLASNGIDSNLNYDAYRRDDAQLFVRWRRLNELRLPDGLYSNKGEKRISLPILADFRSVVVNPDLKIRFGMAGTPLLSPYAAASDDDDGCDDCPPSGACSQLTVLSRQKCCPPSGACPQ